MIKKFLTMFICLFLFAVPAFSDNWYVCVGSFKNQELAKKRMDIFTSTDVSTFISKVVNKKGETLYRVFYFRPFDTYKQAFAKQKELANNATVKRLKIDDLWCVQSDGSLEHTVIVEKEVIKEVPVEKEVIKEVVKEVPVEKEVVKEVVKEVPVVKEVEVIKEVPVEKEVIKEVVKEVPVEKEVIKEVVKEVPVEKEVIKEVVKEVPVVKEVEVIKEVPVEVIKEVPVETPKSDAGGEKSGLIDDASLYSEKDSDSSSDEASESDETVPEEVEVKDSPAAAEESNALDETGENPSDSDGSEEEVAPPAEILESDENASGTTDEANGSDAAAERFRTITVKDSDNGNPISGATLSVNGQKFLTGADGTVVLPDNISDGNYKVTISKDEEYVSSDASILLVDGSIVSASNFSLPKIVEYERIKIVLDWSSNSIDLDAHLKSGWRHVYFSNKTSKNMRLDHDERKGNGVETVTIEDIDSGSSYEYYVYDYTNQGERKSLALSNSKAHVSVFVNNSFYKEFSITPGVTGTKWHVFDIKNKNELRVVNKMIN